MAQLPRYTQKRNNGEYRFNPPQNLVDAGVVTRRSFGTDLRQVRKLALECNNLIDAWRDTQSHIIVIKDSSTFKDLVNLFYKSNDFSMLANTTKVGYIYCNGVACDKFATVKYKNITTKLAKATYEEWLTRGIPFANHMRTSVSRVFNYAIEMEHITMNPFSKIKCKKAKPRKIAWEDAEVTRFLNMAYSEYKWGHVGLIIQMTYEWCQRLQDIRTLEWDEIDFNHQRLHLIQDKRGVEISLPISDDLFSMIQEQRKLWGFQPYVAPSIKPVQGVYNAYTEQRLSKIGRGIMRKAGLSEELWLRDLRRTGVTQMVEADVSLPQMMSVTGHTDVSSLSPYNKHTFTNASKALTSRQRHVKTIKNDNIESVILV